jgi:hypothetical protein
LRKNQAIVRVEFIEPRILLLRGQKVLLDADLAWLYGTTTKKLNQAAKRNAGRFPADFMFRLTEREKAEVVTIRDHLKRLKFSPTLPNAFTEHGAIMAAAVLNSERAIEVSVFVVRAFVWQREVLASHKALAQKLAQLERRVGGQDRRIRDLIHAIRQMMTSPASGSRRIGFRPSMAGDRGPTSRGLNK